MADDKSGGPWGSSFVVLAFAAVSAAYVALQPPSLNSTRPTDAAYQGHEISAAQDIDARLWQDPFEAVSRDVNAAGEHASPSGNSFFLPDAAGAARVDPALTIAVTLPGAPYPETVETRRRLRYAVLAALHVAGFTPADEGHIGYFRTDLPPFVPKPPAPAVGVLVGEQHRPATASDGVADPRTNLRSLDVAIRLAATDGAEAKPDDRALPGKIPFEQFEQFDPSANAAGKAQRVLVLWLDEDFLRSAGKPIASLARLHQVLARSGVEKFAVLGPQDSTTLAAMAREVDGPQATRSCLDSFTLYNFSATAEEQSILKSSGSSASDLKNLFCKQGLRYQQTVNTDDQLAQTLACELMRRDPQLLIDGPLIERLNDPQCSDLPARREPFNHIVLISDWDTFYGNNLARTVQKAFEGQRKENSDVPPVEYFSYLRGLDGRLPNRRTDGQQKSSQNPDSGQQAAGQTAGTPPGVATPENAGQFESAEGQSQFDYLRRLAAELQRRETNFLRNGSHIAAIGVLGSDVYDKIADIAGIAA